MHTAADHRLAPSQVTIQITPPPGTVSNRDAHLEVHERLAIIETMYMVLPSIRDAPNIDRPVQPAPGSFGFS